MFKFKPEGISLTGMQRVYFTCHPEDHARYFERISGDILKVQRCAVFYNLDEGEYEDAETDLAQMNLFVIPVTTRLLTKPCRTVKFDIPFAKEHHIPILPLMMESGLDELYERVFGDLHYLDPNARDDTARSFEEKFKNYITSVLIGDELAEKIRKAFDAYIFLSYRKKDRRYANELMRLIHKNEFCRDIAIWYDEFLTPGEGFNEAIAAALERSKLFALVVTPSLLELNDLGLPNYVMKEEYPAARRSGKKVLPAEMEETDGKALSGKFDGIGSTVKKEDEAALSAALHDALGEIAIAENDDDPEHNFFIGLAYLGGIDVEIDHERAKRLIEGAAEAGLIEAAEKLVSMYLSGEGVKSDYTKAVEWARKHLYLCRLHFENDSNDISRKALFKSLCSIATIFYDYLRDDTSAQEYYRQAVLLYEHHSLSNIDSCIMPTLGAVYYCLADLCDDLDATISYIEKAKKIFEFSYENDPSAASVLDLSQVLRDLGDLAIDQNNYHLAQEYYLYAKSMLETHSHYGEEVIGSLSSVLDRLGKTYRLLGDSITADSYYNQAYKLEKDIALLTGKSMFAFSTGLENQGDILLNIIGDIDAAAIKYSRSLDIHEEIIARSNDIISYGALLRLLLKSILFNAAQQHFDATKKLYVRFIQIWDMFCNGDEILSGYEHSILRDSNDVNWMNHACESFLQIAKIYPGETMFEELIDIIRFWLKSFC
ncbi:MAG: TIR domain-containing protein [Clostridia bacterium]|nr:TIR domain-containing protein [Clostridia bacterium]